MITDKEEEMELLKEFQKLVEDLNQDELTLRRFLRARNHDFDKAETMLRKSMEWRQLNKVDQALTWAPDLDILKAFPVEYPGVDRKNQIILYVRLGSWPIREMFDKGYQDRIRPNIYVYLERLMENIGKTGKELFTLIGDLEGVTYWNIVRYDILQITFKILRDFEANYPERLSEALVLYSPYVLSYTWPLVKPLLTGTTQGKVKFLGSDCRQFIPQLLERIPPSSLPNKLYRLMQSNNIPDISLA